MGENIRPLFEHSPEVIGGVTIAAKKKKEKKRSKVAPLGTNAVHNFPRGSNFAWRQKFVSRICRSRGWDRVKIDQRQRSIHVKCKVYLRFKQSLAVVHTDFQSLSLFSFFFFFNLADQPAHYAIFPLIKSFPLERWLIVSEPRRFCYRRTREKNLEILISVWTTLEFLSE